MTPDKEIPKQRIKLPRNFNLIAISLSFSFVICILFVVNYGERGFELGGDSSVVSSTFGKIDDDDYGPAAG